MPQGAIKKCTHTLDTVPNCAKITHMETNPLATDIAAGAARAADEGALALATGLRPHLPLPGSAPRATTPIDGTTHALRGKVELEVPEAEAPALVCSTHRTPYRTAQPLRWYSPARGECPPLEMRTAMRMESISHITDMTLRTLIARPLSGVDTDGTPWPAGVDLVLVSTIRLMRPVARPQVGNDWLYESGVFAVQRIESGDAVCDWSGLENDRYATAGDAFMGHADLVGRWSGTNPDGGTDVFNCAAGADWPGH